MTWDPNRLLDPAFHAAGDAFGVWQWMRREAPVHWHEPSLYPGFWSVTRHNDIRAVYGDPAAFSSAAGVLLRTAAEGPDPGAGLTLGLIDPPKHRIVRAAMAPFFTDRAVRGRAEAIRRLVQNLLASAREEVRIDFSHAFAATLTFRVSCDLLGVPIGDQEMLYGWVAEAFEQGISLASHRECMQYLAGLVDARRGAPEDDLVSHLVHADDPAGAKAFSEVEVILNCENLLGATENAGLSLAAGMSALLDHPDQWEMLRRDRSLVPGAVEEILRWSSSAVHSLRTATHPVRIESTDLDAGDRIVLWLPSANRDETVYAAPDRFDIRRPPFRQLALGLGEHACIGGALARIETQIVFAELLAQEVRLERDGPETPVESLAVRGPAILPVRLS